MFDFLLGMFVMWLIMKTPFVRELAKEAWDKVKAKYPAVNAAAEWLHRKLSTAGQDRPQ